MTNDKAIWTKVNDNLPNDRDWYLGTFKEKSTGWINPIPFVCDYVGKITPFTTNDGWILRNCTDVDNRNPYYNDLECVAWTCLPEPFDKLD